MAIFENVSGPYVPGTAGDDLFRYDRPPTTSTYLVAGDGYDSLVADAGSFSPASFSASDIFNSGMFSGGVGLGPYYTPSISYDQVESVAFLGTATSDTFSLKVGSQSGGLSANFDARGGSDTLELDTTAWTDPFNFVVNSEASIQSSFGSFANFETFKISTGLGGGSIHTGAGDDNIKVVGTPAQDFNRVMSRPIDIAAGDGNDVVFARALSGTIDGGAGSDSLSGQFGDGANAITVTVGPTITTSAGMTISNFEYVTIGTGAADDRFVVNTALPGTLYGDDGYDTLLWNVATTASENIQVSVRAGRLFGSVGATAFEQMERFEIHGGDGNDSFQVTGSPPASAILLDGGSGTDALNADFSTQADGTRFIVSPDGTIDSNRGQFSNFEAFVLVGGSGADTFTTGAGNDFLNGNGGEDVLAGGAGNDTYMAQVGTQIIEAAGEGVDIVYASVSWTLGANLENLSLSSFYSTNIDGTGNDLANIISGTSSINVLRGLGGDDTLIGGAGADTLDGGTGSDTADYSSLYSGAVTVNLATGTGGGGDAQGDTLISIENVRGTGYEDVLTGNGAANHLEGMGGNDTLLGGADADILDGGEGADTASYATSAVGVTINLLTGEASGGDATGDTLISIENLIGSASADVLIGNNVSSRLEGLGGDDTLIGGAGADYLIGGPGADHLDGGDGNNSASYETSQAGVSVNLQTGLASGGDATGDTLTRIGGLIGSAFADVLIGNDAGNFIRAGAGDDRITGGAGVDVLTGEAGADVFVDTTAGLNGDSITDFGVADRISITDIRFDSFQMTYTPGSSGAYGTINFSGQSSGALAGTIRIQPGAVPSGYRLVASADQGGGVTLALAASVAVQKADHDFNGDGRSDILWRSNAGQMSDWLGQVNGGFATNDGNALSTVSTNWHIAGTGDFNGDGRSDVLWRNDAGQMSDWLGQANGAFVTNDGNAFATVATNWHIAETGDFNGDGRADILWRSDAGQLSDWLGQANGGFVGNDGNAFTTVSTNWHVAGTGDFNGDGRADILWRSDAGQLSDWLGQTNGGFRANDVNAFSTVATNWHIVAAADFNGDGRADILWRNDSGALSDWLGNASGGFGANDANAFSQVSTDWAVADTGDFNGDGRADILWRNTVTGSLSDWLGQANGGFRSNDANAYVSVPLSWQVQPTHDFAL